MTMPAENSCVPTLIAFVLTPRSVVMVDVRAVAMFPRSICRTKKAKARTGIKKRSTLVGFCQSYTATRINEVVPYLCRALASSSSVQSLTSSEPSDRASTSFSPSVTVFSTVASNSGAVDIVTNFARITDKL